MRLSVVWYVAACLFAGPVLHAQTVIDTGFEQVAVAPGEFVRPNTGPWAYANDAGVARPPGRSPTTEVFRTWWALLPAYEGAQHGSTYAGADTIAQAVTFDRPGTYELSVMAYSPEGTQEIPGNPGLFAPLGDGAFRFLFDNLARGPEWVVPAGSDWTRYATTVDVTEPGAYSVGVANAQPAVYFVNYDAFGVTLIPEPSAAAFILIITGCAACWRRR